VIEDDAPSFSIEDDDPSFSPLRYADEVARLRGQGWSVDRIALELYASEDEVRAVLDCAGDEATGSDIPHIRGGGGAAGEWLRVNDPMLTAAGVAEEIENALIAVGLTLEEARAAFRKSGGRPTRDHLEVRERLRRALLPVYEDGRRRDLMAQALGCDRKSIWRLMAKPPHVPNR
jgi:hypothetical protein